MEGKGVVLLGAIAGDVIGSVYEVRPIKSKDFPLFQAGSTFTDDSVLTVAVAQAILEGRDYAEVVREVGRRFPHAGYGGWFGRWLRKDDAGPYGSWGNGSAMRVSPVGWAFDDVPRVLEEAEASAAITHDHPEGIKGAQAVALAVFGARSGWSRSRLREEISSRFEYDIDRSLMEIRPGYSFDVSCMGTVPPAIICYLESESFVDAVRNAVSLGGDSDTLACITGAIAEASYGAVPDEVREEVESRLPDELMKVVSAFQDRYMEPPASS